jgi:hypothetical protein
MNRNKLERYLRGHDCFFHHHGGGHDSWFKRNSSKSATIPRHNEIKFPIVRSICRDLGIPPPPEK